ncbi:MFS transporter [Klebsiella aerogenes]|uniref:MFS transporter n=1 Tax=Klebsiella aerogenes TaxID=548 RepID=UPI00063C3119|nr:MFS transporter [Klebsiella aerogenes]EKZ6149821.1 MFS transporter [Klebsiella aerogenes]EKZ6286455.1 MFS transporter [Klebsiella aerogenes]KLF34335.1 MFS transporter [Klebsiella aerogenes]KLF78298.1 MFS transporter [Klebsiella aerogenes]HBW3048119.1 MFS transporter [Klebsiella aerogenes]
MKTSILPGTAPLSLTLAAGGNQLINWGIVFYMPGTFAGAIANDTGWGGTEIYLGLTFAMLMMAAISPFIARLLAWFGGQRVVFIGSLTIAASCLAMSQADSLIFWYVAWLLAGVGMRLALYDALFAALVNLYGQRARVTISRVTLAGGLASAIFWPLGTALLALMGWRGALVIYSLFGLLSALLLWRMPNQRLPDRGAHQEKVPLSRRDQHMGLLYASLIALVTFISNGTSTHLPEFIASYGLPVTIGVLWGIGQTGARFLEVISGARLSPLRLTLLTTALLPLCFLLGLNAASLSWTVGGFVFAYGAINGLTTVFKATLPLQLFAAEDYARRTGRLLIPAQLLAAVSPFAYAWLNQHLGIERSLAISGLLSLVVLGLALIIGWLQRRQVVRISHGQSEERV